MTKRWKLMPMASMPSIDLTIVDEAPQMLTPAVVARMPAVRRLVVVMGAADYGWAGAISCTGSRSRGTWSTTARAKTAKATPKKAMPMPCSS